jgi:hypothetical protein
LFLFVWLLFCLVHCLGTPKAIIIDEFNAQRLQGLADYGTKQPAGKSKREFSCRIHCREGAPPRKHGENQSFLASAEQRVLPKHAAALPGMTVKNLFGARRFE